LKFTLFYILPILALSACRHTDRTAAATSDAELRQKLIGRWRGDSQLPSGVHVQSETIVDSDGGYILHLTNTLVGGVRTLTVAGTLEVKDGILIDTITSDLTYHTLVPRIAGVDRIIRLGEHELIVRSTNSNEPVTAVIYQRVGK